MSETTYPENVTPVLMPQAGQSMEEGTITAWLVKEGDVIEKGQPIFEIETDKATMEVEATDAGRIAKIIAGEGDIIEVKKPVAFLADQGVDLSAILGTESKSQEKAPAAEKAPADTENADVTPVLMPQAGQSMEEGTITAWLVKEGDVIEKGQPIFEIETDKATMEVEATDAGRIAKIIAGEGAIIEVKKPVAYLAEEGVDISAYLASTSETQTPKQDQQAKPEPKTAFEPETKVVSSTGGRIKASPAARRIAKEKGMDLSAVTTASGIGGRIVSSDIENAKPASTAPRSLPITKMRKMIAKNLTYSKQNVPHFYIKATIVAEKLLATYKANKEKFSCSLNDFVIAACAKTLAQYPAFRSQYKETEIIEYPTANVGIAVGTDNGLTVPVLVGADRMDFATLAKNSRAIIESARKGKIEGMGQGVFTITNLGMFGTEEFSAIINPPEAAILAVGAIKEDVIAENGAIRATRTMKVQLSADHRIVDGMEGAKFVQTLKEILENPEQLL